MTLPTKRSKLTTANIRARWPVALNSIGVQTQVYDTKKNAQIQTTDYYSTESSIIDDFDYDNISDICWTYSYQLF